MCASEVPNAVGAFEGVDAVGASEKVDAVGASVENSEVSSRHRAGRIWSFAGC